MTRQEAPPLTMPDLVFLVLTAESIAELDDVINAAYAVGGRDVFDDVVGLPGSSEVIRWGSLIVRRAEAILDGTDDVLAAERTGGYDDGDRLNDMVRDSALERR